MTERPLVSKAMLLAVDVHYVANKASVAGVAFANWGDPAPLQTYTTVLDGVAAYEPGSFFKRELPCILQLLHVYQLAPQIIVVDGYVFLDGHSRPGLGKHLYDALNGTAAVVGVAKKRFRGLDDRFAVYRGGSKVPLWITAVSLPLAQAQTAVCHMHGPHRIPTLLKHADQLCRRVQD